MNNEIANSLTILKSGKTLLYPTDTVWGIGCDATSAIAVQKIFEIKQRPEQKSLIVLVDGVEMLKKYIQNIPSNLLALLKTIKKPTSIIYSNPVGLAKNVVAKDATVAIRIVQNEFCRELIKQFGKPIVSTSANISGEKTPQSFKEIDELILESVDYIVNLHSQDENTKPSTILKLEENGEITVLRA